MKKIRTAVFSAILTLSTLVPSAAHAQSQSQSQAHPQVALGVGVLFVGITGIVATSIMIGTQPYVEENAPGYGIIYAVSAIDLGVGISRFFVSETRREADRNSSLRFTGASVVPVASLRGSGTDGAILLMSGRF